MKRGEQLHAPAALPPGKQRSVPFAWETGWAPEPVWTLLRRHNNLPLPGIEPQFIGRPPRLTTFNFIQISTVFTVAYRTGVS
jgi:hypothetical protein